MAYHRDHQWIFAVVLLGLTAARIHYTENLSPEDPLNGGHHFYDPVIAELLAASILSMLWSMFASVLYRAFSIWHELTPSRPQHSRDLHAVRSPSHSHIRGRGNCAFHALYDVAYWHRDCDCEHLSPLCDPLVLTHHHTDYMG
jgi:hypothetical protein